MSNLSHGGGVEPDRRFDVLPNTRENIGARLPPPATFKTPCYQKILPHAPLFTQTRQHTNTNLWKKRDTQGIGGDGWRLNVPINTVGAQKLADCLHDILNTGRCGNPDLKKDRHDNLDPLPPHGSLMQELDFTGHAPALQLVFTGCVNGGGLQLHFETTYHHGATQSLNCQHVFVQGRNHRSLIRVVGTHLYMYIYKYQ